MVSIQTVTLSHVALGYSKCCPPRGRSGAALSQGQREMTDHLLKMNRSMCRLADTSAGCGSRLPAAAATVERLLGKLVDLDLVPYSRPRAGGLRAWDADQSSACGAVVPLVAERASLPKDPIHFDPSSYLCADSLIAYNTPSHIVLPRDQLRRSIVAKFS